MSRGSKNASGLTPAQERFAEEYVRFGNASAAFREVFPHSRAWKDSSVWEAASKLLAKVQPRVDALRQAAADRAEVTMADWIREVRRLAMADPRRLLHPDGRLRKLSELDADTAAAIAAVDVDEHGVVKYRLWDKNAALEKVGKFLGAYERDNRQRNPLQDLFDALSGAVIGVAPTPGPGSEDDEDAG